MAHDNDMDQSAPSREKRSKRSAPKGAERGERAERPAPKPRDGSELAASTREEAFKIVFGHASRLVSMKDWSQAGLAKRLERRFKAAPEGTELATEAAAKMARIGAIDDTRYARGFVRARLGKRSMATTMRELAAEGVAKETAQAAVEELREEGLVAEPADQAFAVWRKKFDRYPADDKERGKQARHMASRGFSYDALSKIWARAKAGDI